MREPRNILKGTVRAFGLLGTTMLVRPWRASGTSLGTLIAVVSATVWSMPLATPKVFDISDRDYMRRAVMPNVALGLSLLAAGLLIRSSWQLGNLAQLGFAATVVISAYVSLYWLIALNQAQRTFYRQIAGKLFERPGRQA